MVYVIEDCGNGWLYVESGQSRGFLPAQSVLTGVAADHLVETAGEASMKLAETVLLPSENRATYYSFRSIKAYQALSELRQRLVAEAETYVGNAYVWGGESLTNGADCSGFVQTLYRKYGYTLPRVAQDQCMAIGQAVSLADARPGDLVFYIRNNSDIYHVAIYTGDGTTHTTVEAKSSAYGICDWTVHTNDLYAIKRVIND